MQLQEFGILGLRQQFRQQVLQQRSELRPFAILEFAAAHRTVPQLRHRDALLAQARGQGQIALGEQPVILGGEVLPALQFLALSVQAFDQAIETPLRFRQAGRRSCDAQNLHGALTRRAKFWKKAST